MTDVVETPAAEAPAATAETSTARRGRPRPDLTISRDKQVLDTITEGAGSTRKEIVDALTAAGTPLAPNQVYLSLYRLRKDGKVQRVRDNSAHRWQRTSAQPS